MPSNEYLKQVTIGPPEPLNGKILLEEYRPEWPALFQQERRRIRAALGREDAAVEHVGSTSVPGLCAKPILDLLLLVEDAADEAAYVPPLERAGYTLKIREPDWYQHRMLKGADPAVNLHVFSLGCGEADRMLRFRDWLRSHDVDRDLYAAEKRRLAEQTWQYVQNYADAKSAVIAGIFRRIDPAAPAGAPPRRRRKAEGGQR